MRGIRGLAKQCGSSRLLVDPVVEDEKEIFVRRSLAVIGNASLWARKQARASTDDVRLTRSWTHRNHKASQPSDHCGPVVVA